ncbi:hypothetical protein [Photorhabdus sp. RM96S]|uniref:hypothetical protein n=1 Tax=Photorhabdus sp. RM96S TaxID=3342822 RepID=UPI0036D77CBC
MTEQKYSLEHETAVLGKDGLAIQAGWIKTYSGLIKSTKQNITASSTVTTSK